MRKDQIARTGVAAVVLSMGMLCSRVWADTVLLKNGAVIEGQVTDKNDNYLAIITPENKDIKTYYLASRVDKVNGQEFSKFRVVKNKIVSQKFRSKAGQKDPVVSLVLKDGRTVKGRLIDRNDQYFRIAPEGSDIVEEYLIENIAKAE